jgi:hypothetical protein
VSARRGRRVVGVGVAVAVAVRIQQDEDEGRIALEQFPRGLEAARPRHRHHDQVDRLGRGERGRLLLVGHLADNVHVHPERSAQSRPEGRVPVDDESTCSFHRASPSQLRRAPSTGRRVGPESYAAVFCGEVVCVSSSDETPWSSAQRAAAVRFCTPIFR